MDIETIISVIESAKYQLLFLIYLIEGPVASFLSSVAASFGHLNIFIIWFLVIVAELITDMVIFSIGRYSKNSKWAKKVDELDSDILEALDVLVKDRLFTILLILKNSVVFYFPGFIYLGLSKYVKTRDYLLYVAIICIVRDSIIMGVGYFTGVELSQFNSAYKIYMALGIIVFLLFAAFVVFKAYEPKIKENVKKKLQNKIK
jgi:membrane protein DedA with SNARE-associated domain